MTVHDPYNAFCRHTDVALDGASAGPLRGLSFAAKDVFDVAGHRTGNGNPVWLRDSYAGRAHCLRHRAAARRRQHHGREDPNR